MIADCSLYWSAAYLSLSFFLFLSLYCSLSLSFSGRTLTRKKRHGLASCAVERMAKAGSGLQNTSASRYERRKANVLDVYPQCIHIVHQSMSMQQLLVKCFNFSAIEQYI